MNDIYNEIMIKRDITASRWIFDILLVFTSINVVILSLMYLAFFAFIPILIVIILVPYLLRGRNVEYEYVLTNDQLDFDKIIGRRRRKQLYSLDVRNIELLAPMTVAYKEDFFAAKSNKTVDLASNARAPGRWFVVFNDHKDGKVTVVFEPTVNMVKNISIFIPRRIKGMEYLEEALESGDML